MPAIDIVLIDSGAVAGRMPHSQSPMCRSFPFIGGPCLAIWALSTMRIGAGLRTHRERDAQVADDRTDDVAAPAALSIPPRLAAPQPDRGGVDRFLSERAESLALKRHALELHVAAGEELLEPIVHGTRQHHAAQDLAPFFGVSDAAMAARAKKPSTSSSSS